MIQRRWHNTSCVLKNVTWHTHPFLAKKAWCHFIFRCNNPLCRCKSNVFSDKQTCPSFQDWMVTLTARLSPEHISVYLDTTLMILESSKKGNIQPAVRKNMWQEHVLQQRDFTAEKSWAQFPEAWLLFRGLWTTRLLLCVPVSCTRSNKFSPRMGDSVNWDWQAQWGYDHSRIKMMHPDWAEKTPTLGQPSSDIPHF